MTAYDWTGFYVGGHAGWAWARTDWFDPIAGVEAVSISSDGFIGGGQAGFNWQAGPWLLGIEGDASWSHLQKGIIAILIGFAPQQTRLGTTVENLGSVAGRFGYAWGQWLAYGRAGAAWAHDLHRIFNAATPAEVLIASATETRLGWTIGGGLEYGLAPNWSVKVEYDFMDLGSERISFFTGAAAGLPPVLPLDVKQNIHLVKLGVNYRFGGPVYARY